MGFFLDYSYDYLQKYVIIIHAKKDGGYDMEKVKIHTEYITLGQFLKLANAVDGGGEAKMVITEGLVKVNQVVDTRRGRKLYEGDIVNYQNQDYQIDK